MQSKLFLILSLVLSNIVLCVSSAYSSEPGFLTKKEPASKISRDAMIFLNSTSLKYTESDRVSVEKELAVKIYNLTGRDMFGNLPLFYDKKVSDLKLVKGGTYLENGNFEPIEDKGINEVTPDSLSQSLMYGDFMNRVYSFPIADPGNILYIKYERDDKIEEGYISGKSVFAADVEIDSSKVSITVPKDKELKYTTSAKMTLKNNGEDKEYTFNYGYSGKLIPEVNATQTDEITPFLLYTTATDWPEAVGFFREHMMSACVVDDLISKKAKELTADSPSQKDKVLAVTSFVNRSIKDIYLPLGTGSYKPRAASDILRSGYGDVKDKTVLFITLLKSLNIEAYPALYRGDFGKIYKEIPTIKQFGALVPAVKREDGSWGVIETADLSAQTGYVNTRNSGEMLVLKDKCEFVPFKAYVGIKDEVTGAIKCRLTEDGNLDANIKVNTSGLYDLYARSGISGLGAKQLSMFYDKAASAFCAGSSVISHTNSDVQDYSNPMSFDLNLKAPDFATKQGDVMILNVASAPFVFAWTSYNVSAPARTMPYLLGCIKKAKLTFELELPKGYNVSYMPSGKTFKDPSYGSYELTCTYNPQNRVIEYALTMDITKSVLPANKYNVFKSALVDLANKKNSLIILSKEKD